MKSVIALAISTCVLAGAQAIAQQNSGPSGGSPPPSGGPPPAPPFGMPIALGQAMKAADAAMAQAGKMNRKMSIAVVEPTGELVYFRKMDGAPYSSTDLARGKAVTSAKFRRPSRAFQEQINKGNQYFLTFNVVAAPGGLVLVADGKLVGAIGVSGGTGDEDEEVAKAGVELLK